MPQVILLAMLGAGVYAGFRALARAGERLAADLKDKADRVRQHEDPPQGGRGRKDGGTLIRDPESGVYRPGPRG